jgi:hypothetical protein
MKDGMKIRGCRRNFPTGPTHCETIKGYSEEALNGAISQLSYSVTSGRAGQWERDRLDALKAERERRDGKRRGKESSNA